MHLNYLIKSSNSMKLFPDRVLQFFWAIAVNRLRIGLLFKNRMECVRCPWDLCVNHVKTMWKKNWKPCILSYNIWEHNLIRDSSAIGRKVQQSTMKCNASMMGRSDHRVVHFHENTARKRVMYDYAHIIRILEEFFGMVHYTFRHTPFGSTPDGWAHFSKTWGTKPRLMD